MNGVDRWAQPTTTMTSTAEFSPARLATSRSRRRHHGRTCEVVSRMACRARHLALARRAATSGQFGGSASASLTCATRTASAAMSRASARCSSLPAIVTAPAPRTAPAGWAGPPAFCVVHRRVFRVRASLYGVCGRLSERGHGRRADQVHPQQPRLRRPVRHDRQRALTAHRLRREPHPGRPRAVRAGLQELRGQLHRARVDARALPCLRRGVPTLRAGLPRVVAFAGITPT